MAITSARKTHKRTVMKPYPPLGLLYVSSYLKSGYDVQVFNSTFRSRDDFDQTIERMRPPVVGIYGNLLTRPRILQMTRVAKQCGAKVVLGGPEPASYAEDYPDRGADVVIVGEGEATLDETLPVLAQYGPQALQGVAGTIYRRDDGVVVRNDSRPYLRDLDAQPGPDGPLSTSASTCGPGESNMGWPRSPSSPPTAAPTRAAGAATRCSARPYRRRSPANVAGEVEQIVHTYRPDMLWYADDVFTMQPRWVADYAEELRPARAADSLRAQSPHEDRLDASLIRLLADIGCVRLWIGSESGSQRILDAMQRGTDAGRVRDGSPVTGEWD